MAEVTERRTTPFIFKESASIIKSIGKSAKTLDELRHLLGDISDGSLYFHVYQYFLRQQLNEYTNDFARWAGEGLEERALAEQLSNVDPYDFKDIASLKDALLAVIERYLDLFPEPREVLPGNEFYFCETVTLTFYVRVRAHNLAEFLIGMKYVDITSIYHHFYEARNRQGSDDFSHWLEEALGEKELAEKVRTIDPFMYSLDQIRELIVEAVEQSVRTNMEIV